MMLQYKIPKSKTILHSIPIGSIMVLLLLLGFLITPNIYYSNSSAYAVEDDNVSNSMNNTSTHANDEESSTSLIIGGAEMNEVVDASVGEVAYRKHTVTISASKLKSYTLFISGPEGLNGETAITGANGNTPVDMPKNSWGYAYGQDGNENDMTYRSFTNNAELIDSKLESESSTEDTDFTKNLIFAVKFGNAIAGHYTGTVTLSLAAEPKEVVLPTNPVETWDELKSMQQMTSKACASIGTASADNYPSKTLIDLRDGNEYTITKLDDQNCWMTTNLRITGDSIKEKDPSNITGTITSADSNVSSDYNIPASSSSGWTTNVDDKENVLYEDDENNGAYYNWCAATAGTCLHGTDTELKDKDAPSSICPKGWKLPTKGEYDALIAKGATIIDNISGDKFDGYNVGGAFFPTAGYVGNGYLQDAGSNGHYWSSTASDSGGAYDLYFYNSRVMAGASLRFLGYPVRCIAMDGEDEKEQEVSNETKGFGGIKKLQDMTSSICNQSSIPNGTTGQLYDTRDLNIYDVAKLADGKCWMTQNLRIVNKQISSADSNLAEGATYTIPASSSPWSDTSATTNKVHYAGNATNGANYTWCAATAGSCSSATTNNAIASSSICPRGWKLPTKAQYDALLSNAGIANNSAGSTKIRGAPYNFPYAGYVVSGSLSAVGSQGDYWSSTAIGSDGAYGLNFDSSYVGTYHNARYNGFSVRCIAP